MDYEATDKAALERALLNLGTCPHCRADLKRVRSFGPDVLGCTGDGPRKHAPETWYVPYTAVEGA